MKLAILRLSSLEEKSAVFILPRQSRQIIVPVYNARLPSQYNLCLRIYIDPVHRVSIIPPSRVDSFSR